MVECLSAGEWETPIKAAEARNSLYWLHAAEVVEAGEQRGDCIFWSLIEFGEETHAKQSANI